MGKTNKAGEYFMLNDNGSWQVDSSAYSFTATEETDYDLVLDEIAVLKRRVEALEENNRSYKQTILALVFLCSAIAFALIMLMLYGRC